MKVDLRNKQIHNILLISFPFLSIPRTAYFLGRGGEGAICLKNLTQTPNANWWGGKDRNLTQTPNANWWGGKDRNLIILD